MDVQWYPGHMTKAKRQIEEHLKLVDVVLELIDARVPLSGRNPDIQQMGNGKARILAFTKADLADPKCTEKWIAWYREQGLAAIALDARARAAKKMLLLQIRTATQEKVLRDQKRGIRNRPVRVLVAGIPNVGKSTLINSLAGRASARTGDRPGVTKGQQWIHLAESIDLLDTPGLLWPKFEDPAVGRRLAWIGSVREEILPTEELALYLLSFLKTAYPGILKARYGAEEAGEETALLLQIARNRGCLRAGGGEDTEKAARLLLEEFRHARLGRITLEEPEH